VFLTREQANKRVTLEIWSQLTMPLIFPVTGGRARAGLGQSFSQFHTLTVIGLWLASLGCAQAQDKWVVGQSAPLTGSNAPFGMSIRDGAQAYFAMVNASGGVQGKPIELVTVDDKNERKIAGENAKTLLENKDLVALFGFASATLSLDALGPAQAKKVPFFAPFSGANAVRTNSPVLFTIRASYGQELVKMLSFWTNLGLKRVSVVHYDDEVGKQNLEVVAQFLKTIDLVPTALALKRNAPVSPAEINTLVGQQPEVIINTVLSGAAAQIQKELVTRGRMIPTSSLSFVGADQFISAAGSALPVVRECARATAVAGSKAPMNSTQLEACFAAKVLVEGIRRAKRPVTAQTVLESLSTLGSYDLGGFTVAFDGKSQHGSKFVELAMVTKDAKLLFK
jgi:branched-chain amino acid transport system substrate-binding protein